MEEKCLVFNIQKFSVNDGAGIRTTVFLKGCMLDCVWCHNPESKSPKPQLFLNSRLCVGCGACGACVDACVGALEMSGNPMTVEEILAEVRKDKAFYDNSGGGMTVSGGEPLFHPSFTLALLKAAKEEGLHTCIETSGFAAWKDVEALIPYVDLFLWDVKETDAALHKQFTGVDNARILENLHRLDAAGAKMVLRCPIIPGYNARPEHLAGIAALANSLANVQRIEVEPYHPRGSSKSAAIGENYALEGLGFPAEDVVKGWMETIAAATSVPVKKA